MSALDKLDALESFQARRASLYTGFISSWGKVLATRQLDPRKIPQELVQQLTGFYLQTSMVGSDLVVKKLNEFQEISRVAMKTKNMMPVLVAFGKVCLEMRKELNPATKLTAEDILRTFIVDLDTQPQLLELLRQK
ncbi:unnamed protein product [marine sediment metagenome]|uniref:Uncharacterized protein n=1 Tax=marine sediment metagenome TaxID=412755 RepID=X1MR06_9ZZZZ